MRDDVLRLLNRLGKGYYSLADLEKVTGLARPSLRVLLARWVKGGRLRRIGPGFYALPGELPDLAHLANEQYLPSYLSFESALARYGILSQVPYTLTFATTRRSKHLKLVAARVDYRRIRKELFFGYTLAKGIYVAQPEKALLDELYMASLGRAALDLKTLNLKPIDPKLLRRYARSFPSRVRKRIGEALPGRTGSGLAS